MRCIWCGKDKKKFSEWEQRTISREWKPLCKPCANRRLKNPLNALLDMRKISPQAGSGGE